MQNGEAMNERRDVVVDRAVTHFKLEGMRAAFSAFDSILEQRLVAWSKAAAEQEGHLFVTRKVEEKRKLCLVRADEVMRMRQLLAKVMGSIGSDQPWPAGDQTITSADGAPTAHDGE